MRTTLENILLTYAFDSMWNDDHDGDVESPTGYFARFIVEDEEVAADIVRDYDPLDLANGDIDAAGLVGAWFVWQDSDGSVNYTHRDLPDRVDIDAIYNVTADEYTNWLDADENEA